jgi:signal transduction histidine kinase
MSHELRTPLNAILNFTEMMALGLIGDVTDKQKDVLNKSLNSSKHLLSLINDVLDISKMQAGMLSLFIEEKINLNDELDTVSATVESFFKSSRTQFVRDIDKDLPLVSGDKRRIRQVLLNLVSNAAKFTETGTVTLSAKKRSDSVLFAVLDTGPGIAKEEQALIFQPFIQTDTGIRHANGTGLGLAIARHLAEAHDGKLWVESEPGDGAAFYFMLPCKGTRRQANAE